MNLYVSLLRWLDEALRRRRRPHRVMLALIVLLVILAAMCTEL